MSDLPDSHKNDVLDYERWLRGYPFDSQSNAAEIEREREAERKGDADRENEIRWFSRKRVNQVEAHIEEKMEE